MRQGLQAVRRRPARARSGAKPADHLRVQPEFLDRVLDAAAHDPGVLDQRLRLVLKGAVAALPIEPEAQRRIEDGAGIEREVGSVERPVASVPGRTVGSEIMARGTASRIVRAKDGDPRTGVRRAQTLSGSSSRGSGDRRSPALRACRWHAAPAAAPGPAGKRSDRKGRPQKTPVARQSSARRSRSRRVGSGRRRGSVFHLRKHCFSDKRRFLEDLQGNRLRVSSRLRNILLQL